jgi:hypothetical protein
LTPRLLDGLSRTSYSKQSQHSRLARDAKVGCSFGNAAGTKSAFAICGSWTLATFIVEALEQSMNQMEMVVKPSAQRVWPWLNRA